LFTTRELLLTWTLSSLAVQKAPINYSATDNRVLSYLNKASSWTTVYTDTKTANDADIKSLPQTSLEHALIYRRHTICKKLYNMTY